MGMNHASFLEKQWSAYQRMCEQKGIDAGTKEAFLERNTPKHYSTDTLGTQTPKNPSLIKESLPLFKAEENIILSKRELRNMLSYAAQRGYELGKSEAAL